LIIAASSCGGGGSAPKAAATCQPSGSALHITAHNIAFDKACLAAPANQPFTIALNNLDSGTPHNLAIFGGNQRVFAGVQFAGIKTTSYSVHGLAPGTYQFRCEIHPQMSGSFNAS